MTAPIKGAVERPREQGKQNLSHTKGEYAITHRRKNMEDVVCYNCQGRGHYAKECRRPHQNRQGRGGSDSARGKVRGRGTGRGRGDMTRGRNNSPSEHDARDRSKTPRETNKDRGNPKGDKQRSNTPKGKQRNRSNTPRDNTPRQEKRKDTKRGNTPHGGKSDDAHSQDDKRKGSIIKKRASSANSGSNKKVTLDTAENKPKQKVCYNCGETGHVSNACTNEKTVRQKALPWPQTRRLPLNVAAISRKLVKNWTHDELACVKEFHRLCECLIESKFNVVHIAKEIELAGAGTTQKTFTFFSRSSNAKKEIEVSLSRNDIAESHERLKCWKDDVTECNKLIAEQETKLLALVEKTAMSLRPQQFTPLKDSSQAVKDALAHRDKLGKVMFETHFNDRIEQAADWLARMYEETEKTAHTASVEEARRVIKKHSDKVAEKTAEATLKSTVVVKTPDLTTAELHSLADEEAKKKIAELAALKTLVAPCKL